MRSYYADGQCTVYAGNSADAPVATASVDVLLTDPPYARESLPCWDTLRDLAVRTLRPGGWLIAYTGQAHLPEVLRRLDSQELAYKWTAAAAYRGGGQVLNIGETAVLSEWKPILLYRRRPFGTQRDDRGHFVSEMDRASIADLLLRGGREKDLHPWAQPAGEARELLRRLSKPGDVVFDPFMGSGTTLRAAKDLGLRSIGVELDEAYCHVAVQRLAQEALDLGGAA